MAIEIERKFLVFPDLLPPLSHGQEIVQGYLSANPFLLRYRFLGKRIVMNLKKVLPDGNRFELETEKSESTLEERQFLELMSIYPAIKKIRYKLRHESLLWELDIYQEKNLGLITVDIELPRQDYPISFPNWVNSSADITEDPRYFNINLGKSPYTEW